MTRTRAIGRAVLILAVTAPAALAATPAWAVTIPVACSASALVAAVNLANSTPAPDTLALAGGCTYSMAGPYGLLGANALPVISTPIEMIGPAVITRSSLLPYRIIEVAASGNLTLTTSVQISNGHAVGDGGGILNRGAVTLTNSSLVNNTATLNGGGLANADTPDGTAPAATFTRSPVVGNTALLNGGGIYNGVRGTLTVTGVQGGQLLVGGNAATVRGGGITANNATATTLTQTAVTGNSAVLGAGGVDRQGGTMTTTNTPITANTTNNCVGSSPAVPNCSG